MGDFRPIKTKVFIRFLRANDCYRIDSKSGGSHFYWTKKGLKRRIVIREADKDIPPLHIKSNLKTLGLKFSDLEDFMNKK